MVYPDTRQYVSVKMEDGIVSLTQMQPKDYQASLTGQLHQQQVHLSPEQAAVLAARLLFVVAKSEQEEQASWDS